MAIKRYRGTIVKDDISYIETEHNTLLVMNGRMTTLKDVVLPSEIDGIPVVGIVEWAFSRANIQNITIPKTITFIGQSAFEGCTNLETVLFDAPEVCLAYKSFANCTRLKTIRGNNITVKSDSVFWKCFSLERIYAVFVGSVWSKTFGSCSRLDNLSFADNIRLSKDVFWGCKSLKRLYFETNVEADERTLAEIAKRKVVCNADSPLMELSYTGTTVITKS